MVQFYSTDGKYSFYENFSNEETDSKIKEATENIKNAENELDVAKSNTYKALQQKHSAVSNLEKINKELDKTIKELDIVIQNLELKKEEALRENVLAEEEKNKLNIVKQQILKDLEESEKELSNKIAVYDETLKEYNSHNENKKTIDDLIKNHQLETKELENRILKEQNDVKIATEESNNASLVHDAKQKAVVEAIAEEEKAKADKEVMAASLEKEKQQYEALEKNIDILRDKVIIAHANLSDKTLELEVLKGLLNEAQKNLSKSQSDKNRLDAEKNIIQARVSEHNSIKLAQEKELDLIKKKQNSLRAQEILFNAHKEKYEAEYKVAQGIHESAQVSQKEATDKYNYAVDNLNTLKNNKAEVLESNIIDSIQGQLSKEQEEEELKKSLLLEQQEKLKIAKENEQKAVLKREVEEGKIKELQEINTEKFTNTYEYNKGEDCMISIITILLIIIFAGYFLGITKKK